MQAALIPLPPAAAATPLTPDASSPLLLGSEDAQTAVGGDLTQPQAENESPIPEDARHRLDDVRAGLLAGGAPDITGNR
eukprot:scaffold61076_cov27-Tisochrysis_lutea.AAC.1